MSDLNPLKETIKLYAKQLRTPTFPGYENVIRQLDGDITTSSYANLWLETYKDRKQAKDAVLKSSLPFMKTLDEFDYSRLEHVSESFIFELQAVISSKTSERSNDRQPVLENAHKHRPGDESLPCRL